MINTAAAAEDTKYRVFSQTPPEPIGDQQWAINVVNRDQHSARSRIPSDKLLGLSGKRETCVRRGHRAPEPLFLDPLPSSVHRLHTLLIGEICIPRFSCSIVPARERKQTHSHCTPGPSGTRQSGASSGPLLAVGLVQGAKDSRTLGSQPPPNEFLGLPCRALQLSCFGQDNHLLPLDAQSSLELGAEMGLDAMDGAS